MAVDVGTARGYLDLDISGFLKNLKSAQDEADKQTKNIVTKIGGNLESAGKKMTSAGKSLTKYVTTPLVGVGVAGLKTATDFEASMSKVKAVSQATEDDFKDLRKEAINLGADTAYSATEVADAMTEMAKAGWNSEQILDGMSGVLDAAAASGEDLATVSTIVADAISGFGLEARDAAHIADLLSQAANAGTIDITDLGESFKYIAPVAQAYGMSIEDVTTAMLAMSKAGIKGSQAGTSLRTLLVNMAKPTDDMAAAMDALGVSLYDNQGKTKDLNTILAELREGTKGMTDEQK
ncbi:MAG: phage tail tape measure protein, partial [Clostridia bacterium]|nr:phage tail tape measure protein [Clostridia bacterium]